MTIGGLTVDDVKRARAALDAAPMREVQMTVVMPLRQYVEMQVDAAAEIEGWDWRRRKRVLRRVRSASIEALERLIFDA